MSQTVKAGKGRIVRQAARNDRVGWHGFRPFDRTELACSLWVYRNPSGVIGRVPGYRVHA